jgi:hypothetical protein
MAPVRRLVIDVMKPHDPRLVEFTAEVGDVEAVAGVTATLVERDEDVQNVKLTLEGEELDLGAVTETVEALGATVHSVDEVSCGAHVVEDRPTLQDP